MGRRSRLGSSESEEDGEGQSSSDEGSSSSTSSSSSSYQRYDIQSFARWVEQILPFSLLLVLVFICQHLQGFCVALWVSVVLYKSNEVLRKQTALKGERRMSVLLSVISVLLFHAVVVYWWFADDGLLRPLLLVPPKDVPPFWHGVFIIVVNDAVVRLVGMALKCVLLLYFKNSRGQNYRMQVQLFLAAFKALSCKEMHYGSYATAEQVSAAGDHCAICQEKTQSPIVLRCKHVFCEECTSEWFERERTCPLCRVLVKPANIRSFSDGSTSLLFQLF